MLSRPFYQPFNIIGSRERAAHRSDNSESGPYTRWDLRIFRPGVSYPLCLPSDDRRAAFALCAYGNAATRKLHCAGIGVVII